MSLMAKFFGNGFDQLENNFEFVHQETKSNPIKPVILMNTTVEDPWYPGFDDYTGIIELFAKNSSSDGKILRQKKFNSKKNTQKRRFDILSMFQPGDFLNKATQNEL